MIKALTITLIGAGVIGTGAQTVTPQTVEISAGVIAMEFGGEGFNVSVNETAEFGVTVSTANDRQFTIRL